MSNDVNEEWINDKEWMKHVEETVKTPMQALVLVLENEDFFGYDPYYKDIREFVLRIVQKIVDENLTE